MQQLIAHRTRRGELQYKVRWREFGKKDDTWEPAENLLGATLKIAEYSAAHGIGTDSTAAVESHGKDSSGAEQPEDEDDEDEDDEKSSRRASGKERSASNAPAKAPNVELVGKWAHYRFDDHYHDGTIAPRWYNCKVLTESGKAKKYSTQKQWEDWANVEFETGETMHVLLSLATEGDVWRRGKASAKDGAARQTSSSSGSAAAAATSKPQQKRFSDATERKLRRLMSADPAADFPPKPSAYHPVYNPAAEHEAAAAAAVEDSAKRKRGPNAPGLFYTEAEDVQLRQMVDDEGTGDWGTKSERFDTDRSASSLTNRWSMLKNLPPASAASSGGSKNDRGGLHAQSQQPWPKIDWAKKAADMDCDVSARALMQLWTRMQEREAPPLKSDGILGLGLHPLGDRAAAIGASLPLTEGEARVVDASYDTENEELLVAAANSSGVCPGCLRQLLIHAQPAKTLCWMQTKPATPGECLCCTRDVTAKHKVAKAVAKPKRSKSKSMWCVVNTDKIEHRFQWQGTRWKWYSGVVESRAKWGGWFNVEFEDGETLAVNLTHENEESVWRHHSAPTLVSVPGGASTAFIKAAIKASGKATDMLCKQGEKDISLRKVRREEIERAQAEALQQEQAGTSNVLYPQLVPGFSGDADLYWSLEEDKMLFQSMARHTYDSLLPAHRRWGWPQTANKVGRSEASCKRRSELLSNLAAGLKAINIKSGKSGTGVDTSKFQPLTADSWCPELDAKLCSATALRINVANDHPGLRGKSKTVVVGWPAIAEATGKTEGSCRHRLQMLCTTVNAGSAKEYISCTRCKTQRFKTFKGFLVHNGLNGSDCATQRGYWMCKKCCQPFKMGARFAAHEKSCKGPPARAADDDEHSSKKWKGSEGKSWGKRTAGGQSDDDDGDEADRPPSLRSVSSSFFSSEEVEKKMRKRTWQSSTSEEARLSRWSTSRIPIAVRDTQTVKGFGAFASREIRANEMLGEYAGVIIDTKELRKRQKKHDEEMSKQKPEPPPDMINGMSAAAKAATVAGPTKRKRGDGGPQKLSEEELAARLTGRHYIFDLGCGLSVDASHVGNTTRYLNHASASSDLSNVRAQITNHFGIRCVFHDVCVLLSCCACDARVAHSLICACGLSVLCQSGKWCSTRCVRSGMGRSCAMTMAKGSSATAASSLSSEAWVSTASRAGSMDLFGVDLSCSAGLQCGWVRLAIKHAHLNHATTPKSAPVPHSRPACLELTGKKGVVIVVSQLRFHRRFTAARCWLHARDGESDGVLNRSLAVSDSASCRRRRSLCRKPRHFLRTDRLVIPLPTPRLLLLFLLLLLLLLRLLLLLLLLFLLLLCLHLLALPLQVGHHPLQEQEEIIVPSIQPEPPERQHKKRLVFPRVTAHRPSNLLREVQLCVEIPRFRPTVQSKVNRKAVDNR